MSKLYFLVSLSIIVLLFGCNNSDNQSTSEPTTSENLIEKSELEEGSWINTTGDLQSNEEMVNVGPIEYNPDNKYSIDKTSYISYYNDSEFIKTVLYDYENTFPLEIEKVEDANNIFVSYNESNIGEINLTSE